MKEDSSLRVALPKENHSNGMSFLHESKQNQAAGSNRLRKPSVVGTAKSDGSLLKASTKPKEFHLYLGNLDIDAESNFIRHCVEARGTCIIIVNCEIVKSSRFEHLRSVAAHIVIDARHKEKALLPDSWEEGITIRSWRMRRQLKNTEPWDTVQDWS